MKTKKLLVSLMAGAMVSLGLTAGAGVAQAHPGHNVVVNKSSSTFTVNGQTSTGARVSRVLQPGESTEIGGPLYASSISPGTNKCFTYSYNNTTDRIRTCNTFQMPGTQTASHYIWARVA